MDATFFFADFGAAFLAVFLAAALLDDIAFNFFAGLLFLAVLIFLTAVDFFGLAAFLVATFLDRALFPAVRFFFTLFFAIPRPPLRSSPWYVGGKAASI